MIGDAPTLRMVWIEPAGLDHMKDVMAVMNAAFDPLYGEAWTASQCAGILPMPGVMLRVARTEQGVPVGFSLFRTVAGASELLLLAVHPDHRRLGIGQRLLQDFISSASNQGASEVHLEVRANNPAMHLYRAAEFKPVGRRRDYYSGGNGARFDALTLTRSI
jgi:ribosomal-protein-alanine N-acetyltransferase